MSATPLLLVNGLIGGLRDLVPRFVNAGIVTHAPDMLGYGALAGIAPSRIDLHAQVEHLADWMAGQGIERVDVLGHSVGGAIAMLLAHRHPLRVRQVVNVEGNFSLADAFWSSQVARMDDAEAEAMLAGFRTDPAAWLARSGIDADAATTTLASRLLAHQPASTLRAMARSVVETTGAPGYVDILRAVFATHPVHLLAGARSRGGWSVPDWARAAAASDTVVPGGHMMMIENPDAFVRAVASRLSGDERGSR